MKIHSDGSKSINSRIESVSRIIFSTEMDNIQKIILSLQEISGADLTHLPKKTKEALYDLMINTNSILKKYPIKTYDDYCLISHSDQMNMIAFIMKLTMCVGAK